MTVHKDFKKIVKQEVDEVIATLTKDDKEYLDKLVELGRVAQEDLTKAQAAYEVFSKHLMDKYKIDGSAQVDENGDVRRKQPEGVNQ